MKVCYDSDTLPQFDVSFPEKLLKIVATKGEIFSPKFGNLPPYELEGGGGALAETWTEVWGTKSGLFI